MTDVNEKEKIMPWMTYKIIMIMMMIVIIIKKTKSWFSVSVITTISIIVTAIITTIAVISIIKNIIIPIIKTGKKGKNLDIINSNNLLINII